MDTTFVERLGIPAGVLQMLLIGGSKAVGAREVLLGTHIQIGMLRVMEHGIYPVDAGHADGTGRQPQVLIGVVGALGLEMLVIDAAEREVAHGEFHRRVGLERHTQP